MKNNKDKKKVLAIALLLFAIVGVVGYGAYSYYTTEGEFAESGNTNSDSDNVVHLNATFDPNIDHGEYTIGYGGSVDLTCTEPDSNNQITCSGSANVCNDGTSAVDVEVLEASSYATTYVSDNYTPTFGWTSTRISSGSCRTLTVSATSTIQDGTVSQEEEVVTDPVYITPEMGVYFKLRATQVRSNNGD